MAYQRPHLRWLGYVVPLMIWAVLAWVGSHYIPWPAAAHWQVEGLLAWIGGLVAVAGYLGAVRLAMVPTLKSKTGAELRWVRRTLAAMALAEFLFVSACGALLTEIGIVLSGGFADAPMQMAAAWTAVGTVMLLALHILRTFEQFSKFAGGYTPHVAGTPPLSAATTPTGLWTMTLEDATGARWEVRAEAQATTQVVPGNVTLRRLP